MPATPTGATHEVPPEDLFFSTTDSRGVIDEANEVFVRNARYSREDLIGAPHSIIRHPDMPAGVFASMWDMLGEGRPVCAYVRNLAGDGSSYWAFATITPIDGDRYLSVRSGPVNFEARDLLSGLYQGLREQERAARAAGRSAHEVGMLGRALLGEALRDQGFADYDELQLDLVPVEVAAREGGAVEVPTEVGDPGADALLAEIATLRAELGVFADAVGASLAGVDGLRRDLRRARAHLAELDELIDDEESRERIVAASRAVEDTWPVLDEVMARRKRLRLTTAIARLQAEAIARFVAAAVAGREDLPSSRHAAESLTAALGSIVDADVAADQQAASALTARIRSGLDALRAIPMHLLAAAPDTAGLMTVLDALVGQSERIRSGIDAVIGPDTTLDLDDLKVRLNRIDELAAAWAPSGEDDPV